MNILTSAEFMIEHLEEIRRIERLKYTKIRKGELTETQITLFLRNMDFLNDRIQHYKRKISEVTFNG